MDFDVSVERASGLEALPTDAAAVGLLSSMDEDVSLQVHILHETFSTHLTQEAAFLVVESDMSVQSLFLCETFSTDGAGEGSFTCGEPKVPLIQSGSDSDNKKHHSLNCYILFNSSFGEKTLTQRC